MAPAIELPTDAHGALLDAALESLRLDERVLVQDFLRFLDQLSVIVMRRQWITGIDNAWYLLSQLVDFYAHRNKAERTSPRRLNSRLTSGQRQAIEVLPEIRCDERAIVDVHMAIARLHLPEARLLYNELGLEWPEDLEATVVDTSCAGPVVASTRDDGRQISGTTSGWAGSCREPTGRGGPRRYRALPR